MYKQTKRRDRQERKERKALEKRNRKVRAAGMKLEEAGRTDACETRREATSNSARVQWGALSEWRREARGRDWPKGPLSAESAPHKQRQNNEG